MVQPGRYLIKEGNLDILTLKGIQSFYVFLFDDLLLITRPKKGNFAFVEEICLYDFGVLDLKDELSIKGSLGLTFQIDSSFDDKKTIFIASSLEEKNQWISALLQIQTDLETKFISPEKLEKQNPNKILFIGVAIGNSKAYLFKPGTQELIDLTQDLTKPITDQVF